MRKPSTQVGAVIVQGEKTIEIKASSFNFEPNNIRASQGDTIILNVTNISGNKHNFTIKDPNRKDSTERRSASEQNRTCQNFFP